LPGNGLIGAVLQATNTPPPPSAQLYNGVYDWYLYLGVASGVVTFALLGYVLYRYRARPGNVVPAEKSREVRESWKGLIVTFALMGIVLVTVGAQTIIALPTYETPPGCTGVSPVVCSNDPGSLMIGVIGQQFFWSFLYPNNVTVPCPCEVPVNTVIVLNVTSRDVNHQFGIPDFRVKTDAIPGKYNIVWIQPNAIANYTIQCFELCGVGHATMISTLAVVSNSTYTAWLNSQGST
jgi:cytochrome c oxidase subunit II